MGVCARTPGPSYPAAWRFRFSSFASRRSIWMLLVDVVVMPDVLLVRVMDTGWRRYHVDVAQSGGRAQKALEVWRSFRGILIS